MSTIYGRCMEPLHGTMWGREWVGRPGGWDAGGRQATHPACGLREHPGLGLLWTSCERLPRQQQPYCLRPGVPAIPAPLLPFLRADASLERQRRARHVS